MNNKMNYLIKVIKSCETNEQLKTARRWAFKIIDSFDISHHDKLDLTNQICRANGYKY